MKKILSILGIASLTAAGASSVVACNTSTRREDKKTIENLPTQEEILKYQEYNKDIFFQKYPFLGDLSIPPPEKIIVKNPRKVSSKELLEKLDKTLTKAVKKIDKYLTKNDIYIDSIMYNNFKGAADFHEINDNFDLTLPRILRIGIVAKNNNLLFSVILPIATTN